jgi:ATP-binding cassette subfamily B protein
MGQKTALSPLKRYRLKVILGPLLKLFECAAELLTPFLARYIIDDGIKNNDLNYTLTVGGIMVGIAIVGFGVTMAAQYLAARVSADFGFDLRRDIYHHLSSLSEKQLDDFGKQKVLTLVNNDSFSLQNGVMMFMRLIFRPPFLLIGSTILSFVIDWRAGLIFLGVILFSAAVIGFVMLVSPKKYAAIQSNLDGISSLSSDSLKGARPIRAFDKEGYEAAKFEKSVSAYQKRNMDMAIYNALINPLTFLFINIGMILVVYLGNFGVSEGFLSMGEIVSLIAYLTSSLAALVMFSRLIVSLNKAAASNKRINAFYALEPSIINAKKYEKSDEVAGAPIVRFNEVSLTYGKEGEKPAVSDLSFAIPKGAWVGMIGGTGSGKSTTIALLERLYEPSSGTIDYRGLPLDQYDLDSLRKEISLVSQRPSLFRGTIRSNLLLSKGDASEDEMILALKASLAYEFVAQYSDFLDHPIEEAGANLSGGQKQRLLIARALLKGGDLLILDDATSALDFISDQKVRENISAVSGLTKIIVSQRAGSLKECDLILVYGNGSIIAQGTHEELLVSCPIYKDIYDMQKGEAA